MKRDGCVRVGASVLVAGFVVGCAWLAPKPAWELPPPPVRDSPVVDATRLHRATLSNGLHVIVLEDFRLPRIAAGVTVRRGAASEPLDRAGVATYTAELMQRGAGGRDALAFARAIDDLGAAFDVSADWDSMSALVAGLSRDREPLLGLLADVTLRPRLDRREGERARAEQLAALESQKDEPAALARIEFAKVLYDGHRFGLPVAGTPETVAKLDAAAARGLHRELFVPGNAILFVAGDVRADEFLAEAERVFGAWPVGPVPPLPEPPPKLVPPGRRVVVVDRPELGQAQIVLGHEGIARSDPQRFADSLMNNVLGGGGFSSRLMSSVRSDAGLTYSIGSAFSMRRAPGPFAVATFTRAPEARRVIDLVLAQLEQMKVDPPTAEELRDAKSQTVGGFALGLETSEAIVAALVSLDAQGMRDDALNTYRASIRSVTTEDTAQAARERLHPDRAGIVLVGPASVLVPQLDSLGPVETVKP